MSRIALPQAPMGLKWAENGTFSDEEKNDVFSESVDKILMAAEARQAARAASADRMFDASMKSAPSGGEASAAPHRPQENAGGPLTIQEIEKLRILCASVSSSASSSSFAHGSADNDASSEKAGFGLVDGDSLTMLIPLLEKHVLSAASIDLMREARDVIENGGDGGMEQWLKGSSRSSQTAAGSGFQRMAVLRLGLEAASVLLSVMMSPGVDRRVVSEDSIEACIALMRHHLTKNVIPAVSSTGHLVVSAGLDSSAKTPVKPSPPPAKKLKRSMSGVENQKQRVIRELKKVYKPLLSSVGLLSLLMERIEELVRAVPLDDRPLLTLCSGALCTFSMDPATSNGNAPICHLLQASSIGLITAVFQKYPRHRTIVIEDLFPLMLKLPTSKRSMRTYPVRTTADVASQRDSSVATKPSLVRPASSQGSEQRCIQALSALIVSLIQSCVCMPTVEPSNEEHESSDGSQSPSELSFGLRDCQSICDLFSVQLLKRCARKGEEGGASEFRPILANLIDDLLCIQLLPEYPAAEMILLTLCRNLSSDLLKASSASGSRGNSPPAEPTYLATALAALGKICAAIAGSLIAHRENPLKISSPNDEKDSSRVGKPNEGKEVNGCVCGRTALTDTFMLDCDRCHAWFHGSCVGITRGSVPDAWLCDECRVEVMVMEQTQSFAARAKKRKSKTRGADEMDCEEESSGTGIDETQFVVFRQLLLNYLSDLTETTTSLTIQVASKFHISRWVNELDSQRLSEDSVEPEVSCFDPALLCQYFLEQWDASDVTPMSKRVASGNSGIGPKLGNNSRPCLSEEGNVRLMLALAATKSELALAFPRLLGVILTLMGDKALVSLRKLSVKAISQVIEADTMLMLQPALRNAVSQRFLDEAISVREVAVALVGSYVLQTPAIANSFHSSLLSRLTDPGVSVRKRTVRIFRDIMVSNPFYKGRAAACALMLQRAADPKEDDGVRDLIHSLFQELWFESGESPIPIKNGTSLPTSTSSSPGEKVIAGSVEVVDGVLGVVTPSTPVESKATESQAVSSRNRKKRRSESSIPQLQYAMAAEQMVEVVRSAGNGEVLAALMKELLFGFSDSDKDRKAAERRKRQEAAQRHCSQLVEALIEALIELEENRQSSGADAGKKLVAIIRTIEVFAEATPVLVLNHIDPVLPYLKADNDVSAEDESSIVTASCNIISRLTPIMDRSDLRRMNLREISDDLVRITYRFGSGALSSAVEALARLAHHKDADEGGILQSRLMKLASTFYEYLFKYQERTDDFSASVKIRNNVHRALSVLGSLCRHHDVDDESMDWHDAVLENSTILDPNMLSWSNLSFACYGVFSKYMEKDDVATKCAALRAMSGIFSSRPRVMLAVEQTGLVDEIMSESSHPDLLLDSLRCWKDIILVEEKRVESGDAKAKLDSKKNVTLSKKISGDQDGDATLVGAVLTKHAPRLFQLTTSRNERIRLATVDLLGQLLRQGLINPMETTPYLFALQGDVGAPAIRSLALKLLITEGEKRPDMLRQRVCAGVKQAYTFQRLVYPGNVQVTAVVKRKRDKVVEVESIFGSVFKESIRNSRKQREGLYRSLLGLFDAGGRDDESQRKKKSDDLYIKQLPLLSFAAQVLAHLPYNTANDPLFIIYHISCTAALHGAQLLDRLAAFLRPYGLASSDEHDESNAEADVLERAAKSKSPSGIEDIAVLSSSTFDLLHFAELCAEGSSFVLLLRLKAFLQKVYCLSETRCLGYMPNGKERIADKSICIPDRMPIFNGTIESCFKPNTNSSQRNGKPGGRVVDKDALIRQYAEFRRLMRHIESSGSQTDDSADEVRTPKSASSKKKRGTKRKASKLSDGDSDPAYESMSSSKKKKKRGIKRKASKLSDDDSDSDYESS